MTDEAGWCERAKSIIVEVCGDHVGGLLRVLDADDPRVGTFTGTPMRQSVILFGGFHPKVIYW